MPQWPFCSKRWSPWFLVLSSKSIVKKALKYRGRNTREFQAYVHSCWHPCTKSHGQIVPHTHEKPGVQTVGQHSPTDHTDTYPPNRCFCIALSTFWSSDLCHDVIWGTTEIAEANGICAQSCQGFKALLQCARSHTGVNKISSALSK